MGCTSSSFIEDVRPGYQYYASRVPRPTGFSSRGQISITVPEPDLIVIPGLDQPPPQYHPNVHAWEPAPVSRSYQPEPLPHPSEPGLYALEIELIDTAITAQEVAVERARQAIEAIKANKTRKEMAITQRNGEIARDEAQAATHRANAAVNAGNRYRRGTY